MCVDIGFELLHIICQYHNNEACPIVSVFSFLPFHTHAIPIERFRCPGIISLNMSI